jgi:hypothetical protein
MRVTREVLAPVTPHGAFEVALPLSTSAVAVTALVGFCLCRYSCGGLLSIPLAASNRTQIAEACTKHRRRDDKLGSAACTLQKRKPVDKFDTWGSTTRKPVGKSDTSG